MERPLNTYNKGDIIITSLEFSDRSKSKRRPALIIANPKGNNVIILANTSKKPRSPYGITIKQEDFSQGALAHTSYVKTNIITTLEESLLLKKVGTLRQEKIPEVEKKLVKLIYDQWNENEH